MSTLSSKDTPVGQTPRYINIRKLIIASEVAAAALEVAAVFRWIRASTRSVLTAARVGPPSSWKTDIVYAFEICFMVYSDCVDILSWNLELGYSIYRWTGRVLGGFGALLGVNFLLGGVTSFSDLDIILVIPSIATLPSGVERLQEVGCLKMYSVIWRTLFTSKLNNRQLPGKLKDRLKYTVLS